MPGLRKILFLPFALAVLTAAAFAAMPAWGQSTDPLDLLRGFDPNRDREEDEAERNGLRGVLDPDRDTVIQGEREGRLGVEGLRDTARRGEDNQDNGRGRPGDALTRNPDDALTRNGVPSDQQPRDPDAVDEAERDQDNEEDPFAALGIRMGSFLLFPELISQSVYSDNLFLSSTSAEGDWALELIPSLKIESDWGRHSLTGSLSAIRSYHDRFTTENEETFSAGIAGQLDIRRATNLVAAANYSEFLESRSSNDFPANAAGRSKVRNRDALLEGNHTFNRVTLTLRGEISEEDFDDGILIDGSTENNDDRDLTERRVTGRIAYEFQPGVSAFVEASTNKRVFAEKIDDNGDLNGSSGRDVQAGLSFELSGKLTGEASAGYAVQKPDDGSLEDVDGLIFNAGLEWRASGLTTFRLDAGSDVSETTDAGSAGSIVRNAAISVEHRPRRNIVLGASLGYEIETFSGSNQEDEEWVTGLTGEYIFTRSVALTLGFEHLRSTSSEPGSDYDVNEVRLGVRVRR